MMLTKSLSIVLLAGSSLWAQSAGQAAAAKQLATAAQTSANAASKGSSAPTKGAEKSNTQHGVSASKTTAAAASKAAAKPSSATPKPAAAKAPVAHAVKPPVPNAKTELPAKKEMAATTPKPAVGSSAPKTANVSAKVAPKAAVAKPATPLGLKERVVAKTPLKPVAPVKPVVAMKPAAKTTEVKPVEKAVEAPAVNAAAKEEKPVSERAGRRDPFVSPIVRASSSGVGPICETGKRCLVVDQLQLKGIVKSASGFIAVVENPAKRAYFLRENDPVFNGSVEKITGDSVVFREQTTDKLGKPGTREVTKHVNAPVV